MEFYIGLQKLLLVAMIDIYLNNCGTNSTGPSMSVIDIFIIIIFYISQFWHL